MNEVQNKKSVRGVVALVVAAGSVAVMSSAHAVIDTTAATGGISDAQVAVLAVLGAMITMGAAIFGMKRILRLIGR